MPEYIARISYGKDSLKMLDVIITRGLPLDLVTTTDVWATDTIPAELPPVLEAKARIEEKLWQMYRLDVEHLCARNKDGSKKTYEQMFYHVPVRRSQSVQVERERERETGFGPDRYSASRTCGTRGVKLDSSGIPSHRVQGTITGFPPNTGYNYCQKLKIVPKSGIPSTDIPMVQKTQDRLCQNAPPLHGAPREAQGKKYRGVYRNCCG